MFVIEHVWDHLENTVRNRVPHPKTIDDLFVYLKEEWVKINPDYLKKLVESLLRRVNEVIKSKGRSTRLLKLL